MSTLLLGRAPHDNALLRHCPRVKRRGRALLTLLAYGAAIGGGWYLLVVLRAGGAA